MSDKTKKFDTTDILKNKSYAEPSVFQPTNLLRESRRQNEIPLGKVPSVCILDPDGNLVDYLNNKNRATISKYWACYHSNLYTFKVGKLTVGIIPRAVGASYAVLIAEQLFVSGCKLLISITSAGIIKKLNPHEWLLDTFLLSCRVMGREIEKGILNYIINEAKKNCVKTIKSQYIPTEKNIPIQNFLPECGFKKNNDFWVYDLNNPFKMPDFITTKIE